MPDRVRAGGAGVRDDLAGRGEAAGLERVDHRLLRRVIGDPRRRTGRARPRLLERAIILFAETHPAARRPDDSQLRAEVRRLLEQFGAARQSSCARRDGAGAPAGR